MLHLEVVSNICPISATPIAIDNLRIQIPNSTTPLRKRVKGDFGTAHLISHYRLFSNSAVHTNTVINTENH